MNYLKVNYLLNGNWFWKFVHKNRSSLKTFFTVVSTLQISNSILSDLYQLHNILEEVTTWYYWNLFNLSGKDLTPLTRLKTIFRPLEIAYFILDWEGCTLFHSIFWNVWPYDLTLVVKQNNIKSTDATPEFNVCFFILVYLCWEILIFKEKDFFNGFVKYFTNFESQNCWWNKLL